MTEITAKEAATLTSIAELNEAKNYAAARKLIATLNRSVANSVGNAILDPNYKCSSRQRKFAESYKDWARNINRNR